MSARLDGAPVVAGSDDDRVHAVHDALVVGRCPVGVHGGEGVSGDNAIPDLFPGEIVKSQLVHRNGAPGPGDPPVRQVRKDTQMDFPARDRFYAGGQPLTGRIDRVRTHCISHIVNEMDHKERPDGRRVEHSNLEIPCSTTELFQDRVDGIGFGQQGCFIFVQFELCLFQISDVYDLHLADHERIGGRGAESAAGAGQFCHE